MSKSRTSFEEAQIRGSQEDTEGFCQTTLEFKRRLQHLIARQKVSSRELFISPDDSQEDRMFEKVCRKPASGNTIPEDMSPWHSALLAAMVTTAIAVFSAGLVLSLSGKDNVPPLFSESPETIELFYRRNQETGVKTFRKGKKAGFLIEEASSAHEKGQRRSVSRGFTGNYQEEETRPRGKELAKKLNQGSTERKEKNSALEERITESVPKLVVRVRKGDTISRILKRQFGRSDMILMDAVRELNPEIEDLDRIGVGQKIRLPRNLETAYKILTMPERSGLSIGEKMGIAYEQSAR